MNLPGYDTWKLATPRDASALYEEPEIAAADRRVETALSRVQKLAALRTATGDRAARVAGVLRLAEYELRARGRDLESAVDAASDAEGE